MENKQFKRQIEKLIKFIEEQETTLGKTIILGKNAELGHFDIIIQDKWNFPIGLYKICFNEPTHQIIVYGGKILGTISRFVRIYNIINKLNYEG